VIGFIGSSGCSTGAHLHVEPSASGGGPRSPAVDPYAGDCSPTAESLWVDQGGYRTLPAINCDNEPPVPMCPADTYDIWTCNADGMARRRCVEGMDMVEMCEFGCTSMPVGTDDVCAMPPDADGDGSRADVDCDDANAMRHPGAVDTCGDGIDQDCSSADLPCPTGSAGTGGTGGVTAGFGGGMPLGGQGGLGPGAAGVPATGQVASPIGQGGAAGAPPVAGVGAPWPPPVVPRTPPPEAGCGAVPGAGGSRSALLALLPAALALARLRRRRAAAAHRA
jgi:Putative metal-binding motif